MDYFRITGNKKKGHVIVLRHHKANEKVNVKVSGEEKTKFNYFFGKEKITGVPVYEEIRLENIYSGIHQRLYFDEGHLRYDYIVEPGANLI